MEIRSGISPIEFKQRCFELAIEHGSDSFATDSYDRQVDSYDRKCILFPDIPDFLAFEKCPKENQCFLNVYNMETKWEEFQCTSFYPVADKDSRVFQSCMNDYALHPVAKDAEECRLAC